MHENADDNAVCMFSSRKLQDKEHIARGNRAHNLDNKTIQALNYSFGKIVWPDLACRPAHVAEEVGSQQLDANCGWENGSDASEDQKQCAHSCKCKAKSQERLDELNILREPESLAKCLLKLDMFAHYACALGLNWDAGITCRNCARACAIASVSAPDRAGTRMFQRHCANMTTWSHFFGERPVVSGGFPTNPRTSTAYRRLAAYVAWDALCWPHLSAAL